MKKNEIILKTVEFIDCLKLNHKHRTGYFELTGMFNIMVIHNISTKYFESVGISKDNFDNRIIINNEERLLTLSTNGKPNIYEVKVKKNSRYKFDNLPIDVNRIEDIYEEYIKSKEYTQLKEMCSY